jgi:molybdenum cofactor cytidylyltransferase
VRAAALVLAAGRASRMGVNKLVSELDGLPLIAHVVDAALVSRASSVTVVVGESQSEVQKALALRQVRFVSNPDTDGGLASSLATGLLALGSDVDGAVVCLGDMPRVRCQHIDALIEAFETTERSRICAPVHRDRRGNPVLWPARWFVELTKLRGDIGGRQILRAHASEIELVPVDDPGVLIDVDTPEALVALKGQSP